MKGVKTKIVKGRVEVKSEVLDKHPLLNLPIRGKVQQKHIPENRPSINEWFQKHFKAWI